jgi:hypothetical protein
MSPHLPLGCTSYSVIEPLLVQGSFAPVLQTGVFANGALARREGFADVPLLTQLLDGKLSGPMRDAFGSWLRTVEIGKYYALPPGTPAEYLAAYRAAFARMQDDPEFRQLARSAIDPDYVMMSAADTRNLIEELVATPAEALELINGLRHKYGLPSG